MLFPASFKEGTALITSTGSDSTLPQTSIFYLCHRATKPTSTKQSVIYLHGYPQNHTLWHSTIDELVAKHPSILEEYDILIPDLPGLVKQVQIQEVG